jgi:hypothetical protein
MNKTKKYMLVNNDDDLCKLDSETGIQLGVDSKSVLDSIAEIRECEEDREKRFNENCDLCHSKLGNDMDNVEGNDVADGKCEVDGYMDSVLHTPLSQVLLLRWRIPLHLMVSGLW